MRLALASIGPDCHRRRRLRRLRRRPRVGPEDRTNEFGFGDGAASPPNGGDLLESTNFTLVIAALKRELGAEGAVRYLSVERAEASATGARSATRCARSRSTRPGARSQAAATGRPAALIPVTKLDPAAIDKLIGAAQKERGAPVENLTLHGQTREWSVDMVRGEPDSFIANLDGGGLRLSGEPNPVAARRRRTRCCAPRTSSR